MNIVQTDLNTNNEVVNTQLSNSDIIFGRANILLSDAIAKEKNEYYERFQKENVDFIQTLLRLKQVNPNNNYTETYSNPNIKTQSIINEGNNEYSSNKLLLLTKYPKPYQPHLSSSLSSTATKPKRAKSRSLIRTTDITPITPLNLNERQKCLFTPFIINQIEKTPNFEIQPVVKSNCTTSIKPIKKETNVIPQRTDSRSSSNQPNTIITSSLNGGNTASKNNRSNSSSNNKKRLSIAISNTTTTSSISSTKAKKTKTKTNPCISSHKKIQQERVLYHIKNDDSNGISIIINKKKEHCVLNSYSKASSNLLEPKSNNKPTKVITTNPTQADKQIPNVPIAEIDLLTESNFGDAKQNVNDEVKLNLNEKFLESDSKSNQCPNKISNSKNRSFIGAKTQKRSLSFIEKTPVSKSLDKDKDNHKETKAKPIFIFEKKKSTKTINE